MNFTRTNHSVLSVPSSFERHNFKNNFVFSLVKVDFFRLNRRREDDDKKKKKKKKSSGEKVPQKFSGQDSGHHVRFKWIQVF